MIRFKKDIRPYNCFSNFYPCTVVVDGMQFRSAEAAFQAQKVPKVHQQRVRRRKMQESRLSARWSWRTA